MRSLQKSITKVDVVGAEPTGPQLVSTGDSGVRFEGDQQVLVREGERCWIVQVRDITLLESEGNYTRVHFGTNRAMVYRSLTNLQNRLDPHLFFRANRRTVINLGSIKEITRWVNGGFLVVLNSGSQIQVSRRQAQLLRSQMAL